MTTQTQDRLIVSKKRVTDHGEVYTPQHIVTDMLDLVKHETERIESRFLEPACGTGNFLSEILNRKLGIVKTRYSKVQIEYERYSILAASSIYGIDILEDNIVKCRKRLFNMMNNIYSELYKNNCKEPYRHSLNYILGKNIIWGDALSLRTVSDNPQPIIFTEWSSVNHNMLKRRDFTFSGLMNHEHVRQKPLFSDLGDDVFIPEPLEDYPLVYFLAISDMESSRDRGNAQPDLFSMS